MQETSTAPIRLLLQHKTTPALEILVCADLVSEKWENLLWWWVFQQKRWREDLIPVFYAPSRFERCLSALRCKASVPLPRLILTGSELGSIGRSEKRKIQVLADLISRPVQVWVPAFDDHIMHLYTCIPRSHRKAKRAAQAP